MVVRTRGTGSGDTHMELKAVTHTKNECSYTHVEDECSDIHVEDECSDTHVEMHAVTHTWNRMHWHTCGCGSGTSYKST